MARIKKEDVFDPKLFTGTTAEIIKMIEVVKSLKTELLEVLKVSQQALKGNKSMTNAEDIKKQANAITQVTAAEKNLVAVEKERVRLESRLAQARSKESQDSARIKLLIQEENRAKKERARETTKELGAYTNLSAKLNRLRRAYKNLAVQEKQNTAEGKRLLRNIQQLDTKLKNVDASVGQFQRSVGNYGKALNGLGNRLRNLAGAFGVGLGIAGFARLMRSTIGVITDFDSAIANLGAISQATGVELDSLKNNALELGETTRFTATEVAGLQTELAKLGFTTPQIIQSTESILNLASATGSDLSAAAKLAGSTMRAFGLEATEMERVTSVLGVATTKSGLNMEFLETAMSKVAPVSKALGFSIEESTALLGTLANSGFDASTAATSTRNILLKLAKSSGSLAKELGKPVRNLPELVAGLKKLEEKGVDLAGALELTDVRSVAAFKTFMDNTDTLVNLKDGITDVNDELKDMAAKQLDTVNGQLDLLNSKWQGMILGTSGSAGAVSKLKNAISFLTNNLETILNVIIKSVKYFVIFKATMLAVNLAMKVGKAVMIAYRITVVAMNRGIKSATSLLKIFNTTIKSNPIGLLISGLTTAIALLWDFSSAADSGAKAQELLNQQVEAANNIVTNRNEQLEASIELLRLETDETLKAAKEKGASEKKLRRIRNESFAEQRKLVDNEIKILQDKADAEQKSIDTVLESAKIGTKVGKFKIILNEADSKQQDFLIKQKESGVLIDQDLQEGREASIKIYQTEISELIKRRRQIGLNIISDKEFEASTNKSNKTRDRAEEKRLADLKRARDKQSDLIDQYIAEAHKQSITSANDLVEAEKKIQVDKGLANKDVNVDALEDLIDAEFVLREAALRSAAASEIYKEETTATEIKLIRLKLKGDLKELEKEKNQAIIDSNDEVIEAQIKGAEIVAAKYKELTDEEMARRKELAESLNAILDVLQEKSRMRTQERIALMDEEVNAAKKRQDELKRLAEQGNIDAQRSLAAEEQREQELQLKKQKAQRRQQIIDAAISGFKAYSSKVEQGSKTPLRDTIKDLSGLAAFIKTLPTFYEGTENVGESLGQPQIAGKDGYIVRVDKAERIVDPETNKKLGGISNSDLGRMAENYNSTDMRPIVHSQISNRAAELMNNSWTTNQAVLQKFDKLEQSTKAVTRAIKNMPSTEWNYDEMSDAVVQKVRTLDKIDRKHYRNGALFTTKK